MGGALRPGPFTGIGDIDLQFEGLPGQQWSRMYWKCDRHTPILDGHREVVPIGGQIRGGVVRRHLGDDDAPWLDHTEELSEVGPRHVRWNLLQRDVAEYQRDRVGSDTFQPVRLVQPEGHAGSMPTESTGHRNHGGRDVEAQYCVEVIPQGLGEPTNTTSEVQRQISIGKRAAEFLAASERGRHMLQAGSHERIEVPTATEPIRFAEHRPQRVRLGVGVPHLLHAPEIGMFWCVHHLRSRDCLLPTTHGEMVVEGRTQFVGSMLQMLARLPAVGDDFDPVGRRLRPGRPTFGERATTTSR